MKKKLFFAAGLVYITLSFTSCESLLENCKVCHQSTYDSAGALISEDNETKYCDAALQRIEDTDDLTISGVTTKWSCR